MTQTVFTLFEAAIDLMGKLIYVIIGLALLGFMWGVLKFLFSGGSEKLKKEGKDFMIYGILILFVMSSMWGIVYLFRNFVLNNYVGDIDSGGDMLDDPAGSDLNDTPGDVNDLDAIFEQPDQYAV